MKEFLLVAVLALFSDVVVPRVVELSAPAEKPLAELETAEAEEAPESADAAQGEEAEEEELERLREENRVLKELVGEKELALRQTED